MKNLNFSIKNWASLLILTFAFTENDLNYQAHPSVIIENNYVDLRSQQTPLRNQGSKGACILFAGVAAVEANYKRWGGYADLDLSEEFINFARQSWYLQPIWTDQQNLGINGRDTQLGSAGGGGGVGVLAELSKGFKIPQEEVMPYQSRWDFYEANYSQLQSVAYKDALGNSTQPDYSYFNRYPGILDYQALHSDQWFTVNEYREVDATDTDALEAVLRSEKEVVWDFEGANPASDGGMNEKGIWSKCFTCPKIAHSVLLVGFDKRDPDPNYHYFIVKNSWGTSCTKPGLDGYTAISYNYVRNYGIRAAYIVSSNSPQSMTEYLY